MFRKLTVIVLVVLFSIQTVYSRQTAPLDPIIELAKEALQFVNKFIDFAFEQSKNTLHTLVGKLDYLRQTALTIAEKQIQRESELLHKLIEAVKNRSSDANLNILECLEKIEIEAGDVQENAVNSSMSCIDASIAVTGDNLLIMLEDLQEINVDFSHHEAELDNCKRKLFPFECIKNVVLGLEQVALSIPAKIKADVDKATLDFLALGFEIFQCARDATEKMQEENVEVFNDFSKCIHGKDS